MTHGSVRRTYFPVRVDVAGTPTRIFGAHNFCLVLDDVHVRCWGDDRFGAMGRGTTGTENLTPTAPVGLD
jgi:hypothetical protein